MRLPVEPALPAVRDALQRGNVVVTAPPGSGKTTRVPWVCAERGRTIVLEPRRLAARLAAEFMARSRGESVGRSVGLVTRHERKLSRASEVVVMTEGVLLRQLASDPELDGTSVVVLDEFHERSVQLDLAIALLAEVQSGLRPDLRIVVMSATIDPAPVQAFLHPCALVEAAGRPGELTIEHDPVDVSDPSAVARAVRSAFRKTDGDVLVFLPGAPEIRRVRDALKERTVDADVETLFGEMRPEDQDRALAPRDRRRVILSTNVAESSVTVDGVRCVVDAGTCKQAEYDPVQGVDRLQLARIGRFSADQRAGRAARQGPGLAVRLWEPKEFRPDAPAAEIHRVDPAPVLMTVLGWSPTDPVDFGWFEAPAAARLANGVALLRRIGLVEADGFRLTERGARVVSWPLHPRWSVVVDDALDRGLRREAMEAAAVSEGREVLRDASELEGRVDAGDLEVRAAAVFGAPGLPLNRGAAAEARRVLKQLERWVPSVRGHRQSEGGLARALLAGFPDRVGRVQGGDVALADGGAARIDRRSVVTDAEWIIAVELAGARAGRPWVRRAARLELAWLEELGIEERTEAVFDARRERVLARAVRRFGALILAERPSEEAADDVEPVLAAAARERMDRALPWTDEARSFWLRLRLVAAHLDDVDAPDDLREDALPLVISGCRSFAELRKVDWLDAWRGMHPRASQIVGAETPTHFTLPSGRRAKLDYREDGPPVLSAPIQELFGLHAAPQLVRGAVPAVVELLGPNRRPIQTTRDLGSFWSSTYAEVRKDLRGRYPKHHWPEHPTLADAGPLGRRRRG